MTLTCNDARNGCLVGPETPAECIETDGKQLIDVCDRHKKGDDGTHVYNASKTKRVRVWPNIQEIEVKDWAEWD